MMLGLKRDLRVEGEGVIYPQEVGYMMIGSFGDPVLGFIS